MTRFVKHLSFLLLGLTRAVRVIQDAYTKDTAAVYTKSKAVTQLAAGADAETGSGSESEGIILPNCPRHMYDVKTAAQESFAWCDPRHVPVEERAPEKLQGLYWLKGLPLPDVMACFSTGTWDQDSLTLKVQVYHNFMWRDTYAALSAVSAAYKTGITYYVTFENEALEKAVISSRGDNLLNSIPVFFFNSVSHFPFEEQEGTNGLKWSRPSYFGIWPLRVKVNEYEAWKVMDGTGGLIAANHEAMLEALEEEDTESVTHFPETCSEEEQASSTVTPGSATCSGGLFVTLAEQIHLAIAYIGEAGSVFATFKTKRGCTVSYKTSCIRGYVAVIPEISCPEKKRILKLPKSSPEGTFKDHWQVCSDTGGILTTPYALIDQTWSTDVPAESPVSGCVRILAANDWPELQTMRGVLPEQQIALIARRQAVGGCPLFRNDEDRRARGGDFEGMGTWLNVVQRFQKSRATGWSKGQSPKNTFANYVSLGFMGLGAGGNRTTAFTTFAELNCGEPAPFSGGPQVFRHAQVAGAAADPHQVRVYSTATVPQSEACFQRTIPLFTSSGTPEHTEWRQLIDAAGFATMHETVFPEVTARVPDKGTGEAAPSEKVVGRSVLERVMMAVWGQRPTEEIVDTVLPYLDNGKLCIFGQTAQDMLLLRSPQIKTIAKIRETNAKFGMEGPRVKKAEELFETGRYPAVKKMYEEAAKEKSKDVKEVLATDVGDAVLFAGLLGTSDMTTKCIQFQWRDPKHVALYQKDKVAYLHELMRYDGAVTSFTTALKTEETWKLEGLDVPMPKGMPVQMSLATANRDRNVFDQPDVFDPERANIGEQVAWNGRLRDVMARNYTAAPRFCPGYKTSIKIAMQVCDHYTQHLSKYSSEVSSYITGTVEILKPGDWQGHEAIVSYTDFKTNKICVVKPDERPTAFIGCFSASELKVIDPTPVFPRTMEDEAAKCPSITDTVVQVFAKSAFTIRDQDNWIQKFKEKLIGKSKASEHLSSKWVDDYSTAFYSLITHMQLRRYVSRHSDVIKIPVRSGRAESFRVGNVVAPNVDIDDIDVQTSTVSELAGKVLPNSNCLQNMLRTLPFEDVLDDPTQNTWEVAMGSRYKRKKDWLLSFYKMYVAEDGSPVWPKPELDLAQLFLRGDTWDDRLEMSMAFDLIGVHRVEVVKRPHGGETLTFAIKLNSFSGLPVREGFGIYQGDMYFTSEGMPAIIELADGTVVQAGDKDWQYWKFVWRSALVTTITLVDHLHTTHFKTANHLAQAARATLTPVHPLRRLLSIFTFGTIQVNLGAMHALAGPDHALHRSSPFKEFEQLSELVPTLLPDVVEQHKVLLDEEAFNALPARLQEAPYYKDGRLLFGAIARMLRGFFELYKEELCGESPNINEAASEINNFRDYIADIAEVQHIKGTTHNDTGCIQLGKRLAAALWTVTGWHRHVGTVADFYVDPDLASFSWKDGEAFPRPKQTLILSVIAAFTSNQQPKLTEDYLHLFRGIDKEEEAVAVWENFHKDLLTVSQQVKVNNVDRPIVKNYHADPDIVECSVAV